MKKGIVFFTVLLALFVGQTYAGGSQEDNVIVFASDVAYAPMEYVDENGDMVGFDIDMLAELAKVGGFEYKVQNTAWDGIFAGLANGAYDAVISSVTITDERKLQMDFTAPYINAGQVLVVKTESEGLTSLDDFNGKKIGVQIGTTADFTVSDYENIEKKSYDQIPFAFEDLINGNVDGVVVDSVVAADYVSGNENYNGKLKVVGEPFTDEYFGIAVKKGNAELIEKLNAALEEVIASGKRDELINKWLR
ncbi:basic amino acid ABC transporter substrate-binding protein [Spirochaeta cellobiosiphila]|uniref:basic amino acid ABC transporter substrate-binding protein n=1 Tax=Spirochaeta cellobiosiphila TaxID=504483 RepID=UPI0003FE0901|nr:basic amino acid ABC transporter substrate-binding protein [Spirochaeta cellobiosiphila]